MSLLKAISLSRRAAAAPACEPEPAAFVERRGDVRRPVFQDAMLVIDDYYKMRAVITDLSARGARVDYPTRMDLPFRVRLIAPSLKHECWARVVWQHEGAAGLEFLP